MNFHAILGAVAAALAILSYVPYVASILHGKTRPSRTTFGIWAFISVVEVSSYAASGARSTLWLPLIYAVGGIVVFALSIKRGMGGTQKLDIYCVAGAVLGVAGWVITKNPHVALYLSIFASACGFAPTIKKAYLHPKTENTLSWGMAAVAAVLNVLAISDWAFYNASYPIYMLLFDGTVALLVAAPSVGRRTTQPASQLSIPAVQDSDHQML